MIAFSPIFSSSIDRDVLTFSNHILATHGITLADKEVKALNHLVRVLKEKGIWAKCVCIYPFVGSAANAHAHNLVNPTTFTLTFVGSPTHNFNGMLLNGTTQYASSPFTPNANTTQNDAHLAHGTTGAVTNSIRIGCGVGSNLFRLNSNIAAYSVSVNSGSSGTISVTVPGSGLAIASRTIAGEEHVRFDTYSATRTASSTSRTVLNVLIGSNNMSGSPSGFADGYTQYASLGLGLTTQQMSDYRDAVAAFQNQLGR